MKKLLLATILIATTARAEELKHAKALLIPLGESTVTGGIKLSEIAGGGIEMTGQVVGLGASKSHGFHIHEFGDCSTVDGTSAGAHFKVGDSKHAGPDSPHKHLGDLGNLKADGTGMAQVSVKDKSLSLTGTNSVLGRSVVVHANEDDLKTDPSGNSGARIACGVIGLVK